jgi:hypothetical protein
MDKIITTSGFEYQIEPDAADDLEVFEAVRNASSPDVPAMEKIHSLFEAFRMIIGDEQDKAVRAYLKEKHGRLRTSDYKNEAEEVFIKIGGNKKK